MTHPLDSHQSVRVELGARGYDILIGEGLIARAGDRIAPMTRAPRVFVLSDETVAGLHLDALSRALQRAGLKVHARTVVPGEASKSLTELEATLGWLLEAGAGRSDVLIAFGGGVVGDLGGLAAALMKRGMRLVQVPTTLLAQVDSSVGGKTAVNAPQGKNLIGCFYQPALVLADTGVLASLPARERAAGYAEVVKYGLLGDFAFFEWLEANGPRVTGLQPDAVASAVARSCQAKADIVAADEREGGVRALLNLGHTFGHALEAASGFGPGLLHGEAVACGMAMAARYSCRLGLFPASDVARCEAVLERAGLATAPGELPTGPFSPQALLEHMQQDKKMRGRALPLILLRGIGRAFVHAEADMADLLDFLQFETQPAEPVS